MRAASRLECLQVETGILSLEETDNFVRRKRLVRQLRP
jgi:hypothetical protein